MSAPERIDRRNWLRLAAASATSLWLPRRAWAQAKLAVDPFSLGVASGSPDDNSVVLWTRLMGAGAQPLEAGPMTVRWEVADDERFSRVVQDGQAQALPELAHSVHAMPVGLQPDRWYHYRFLLGDWVSPVGRTRTLPVHDALVQRVRLAYASCQCWEHGYFSAWRHLREEQPDFVLFLGDYIYEYPGATNAVRQPTGGWVTTLADYRARHALYKTDIDLQRMHAACPWFVTWDDHEVQNDYAADVPGNSGPEVADPRARRIAAYQAYYEHMPLHISVLTRGMAGLATGAEMRVQSDRQIGQLARLFMLDARQYRDPQVCTPGGRHGSGMVDPSACPAWDDPKRTFLGQGQERWLDSHLEEATQGWTLLGQSTLFGPRNYAHAPARNLWNDGWDGYSAARARLVASLQKYRVANPVLFGGDVHQNWVGHVKADYARPESDSVGVEFCGTSITSRTSGANQIPAVLAENPHFIFADARYRGYGVADLTPQQLNVRLRAVERVEDRTSGIRTLASFAVQSGRPVVEQA